MLGELHELYGPGFLSGFDEHGADWVDTEGLLVPLLLLDEVVVAAKLLKHVGYHHRAAVGFVKEVGELLTLRTARKPQRKERVRLDGEPLGFRNLLPKELAALL
jgi:hypothetical protein